MKTAVLWGALLLAGCAHRGGAPEGFSEARLNQRAYRVSFTGDASTSPEAARMKALRRAAEVSLENGFHAFCLAGSTDDAAVSTRTTPTVCNRGPYGNVNCVGGHTRVISQPTSDVTVEMLTRDERDNCPPANLIDCDLFLSQFAAK